MCGLGQTPSVSQWGGNLLNKLLWRSLFCFFICIVKYGTGQKDDRSNLLRSTLTLDLHIKKERRNVKTISLKLKPKTKTKEEDSIRSSVIPCRHEIVKKISTFWSWEHNVKHTGDKFIYMNTYLYLTVLSLFLWLSPPFFLSLSLLKIKNKKNTHGLSR